MKAGRLRLERLPLRAFAAEREAPRHRHQRPIGHHRSGIAGRDLLPEIRPAKLVDRIEPARDFGIGAGQTVEVAHACMVNEWVVGCLGGWRTREVGRGEGLESFQPLSQIT